MKKVKDNDVVWTKEAIGKEILIWRDRDPAYTLTLVPLALSQGLITEEEAALAKEDLDNYYKAIAADAERAKENKAAIFLRIFQDLGFSATKLLWRVVELYPSCFTGEPHQQLMKIPHERLLKQLKYRSTDYYSYLKHIESLGFMERIKGNTWFVDFDAMKAYIPKSKTITDDTALRIEMELSNGS